MPIAPSLIVGLGNPGPDYETTRHNIGFMAVDAIAARYQCGVWKKKFKGLLAAHTAQPPFFLLKPSTFMNLSGEAVGEAMRFYQLAPADVIVFHDDLDLPAGEVRVKQAGGTGGHNGLKSIDAHIGVNYHRVRLGIGRPQVNGMDLKGDAVSDYVLNPFPKADRVWLETLIQNLAEHFDDLLKGNKAEYAAHATKNVKV